MYDKIRYLIAGDHALVMEFGEEISEEINARIKSTRSRLESAKIPGILELIPTYRSITILYDPLVISFHQLVEELHAFENIREDFREESIRLIEIPTVYGGDYGPDLGFVAEHAGLTEEEVIRLHSGRDYLVYMLGFSPGFTYLGGMREEIATPRLDTPRLKIPAGSVGIAGSQTGIYPSDSPGGWQLIGRTPVKLYDERQDPPVCVSAGDYIRYVQIDDEEFKRIYEEVEKGRYRFSIRNLSRSELHNQD